MRRSDRSFVKNAGLLTICGLLSGVVVAAAAFPAMALSGIAAKAGGDSFAALPAELKRASTPQATRVVAADGKTELALFWDEFRSDVPAKGINKTMLDAIVSAEDHKFYEHRGVDIKGIARAFVNNSSGADNGQQGASTLTMQYVRMTMTYSAHSPKEVVKATKDSNQRKVAEIKYAMQVEKEMTKQEILVGYLNQAPFGNSSYGIAAAAQVYFQKSPKNLTIAEAALLAGMVKAPTGFNPTSPDGYPRALDRRNWVIGNMRDLGYITPKQATDAIKSPLKKTVKRTTNGCAEVRINNWGFFCDFFYRWWLSRPEFGKTEFDRERLLKGGGYRIVTSLDPKAQAAAWKNVTAKEGVKSKDALLVSAVEPKTGRVRALVANRRFKVDDPAHPENKPSSDPRKAEKGLLGTYPNTTNPLVTGGGDIRGYQAGSVFKMFTMVAALENGMPLAYPINTTNPYRSPLYRDPGGPCGGQYCPSNASKSEKGPFNMWTGFGASVNTYFVPLQERVGAEKVVDVAERFGVQFREPTDKQRADKDAHMWGSFTLGVSASTPLEMANAYATLAADGLYCQPIPVEKITGPDGKKIDVGDPHCTRATEPDVARATIDAARCPVGDSAQLGSCGGHATARGARGVVKHPIFGKTGTTDNDRTASLIIGTTSMVVAGYLVNPDYQNHPYKMDHDVVNPAVENTLRDLMKGKPSVQFKRPKSTKIALGEQRTIPGVECTSIDEATRRLEGAGFEASKGAEVPSACPKGQAAGTEPSGRTVKGGYVSIQVSAGTPAGPGGPVRPGGPKPGNPGIPGIPLPPFGN